MYYLSCKKYLSTRIVFRHHPLNLIVIVKHEYLRSRAYIRLSLSSPLSLSSSHRYSIHAFNSVIAIQILLLSRYSCFYLGSLHPRILFKMCIYKYQIISVPLLGIRDRYLPCFTYTRNLAASGLSCSPPV